MKMPVDDGNADLLFRIPQSALRIFQGENIMEPIRVGMVGVGGFAGYRRKTMHQTGLYKLVACYDYIAETAKAVAAEEQCDVEASYDALLARTDIEAVVVSTGATSHMEYCVRAAQAGKHFFVEKPLCCDAEELKTLLSAGEQAGVVMGMGHSFPDGPVNQLIQDYIAQDKLGTVTAIEMTTAHGGGWCVSPWRFIPEKNPGGMLFQCGVHLIYWIEAMFGRVTDVSCMMRYDVNPGTQTSDATTTLLRLENGLLATINAHHVTAYEHHKYIYGTKGNLYIHESPSEIDYQARSTEGKPEEKIRIDESSLPAGQNLALTNLITWANAIRGEGTPAPSIYDGASAVAVVFAAAEAARTGRTVQVPDVRARLAAKA